MSYHQQGYRPQARQQQRSTVSRAQQTRSNASRAQQSRKAPAKQQKSQSRKRKPGRSHSAIKIFLLLAVFAFLATAGVMAFMVYAEVNDVLERNTFYPGIYVDGVELSGMQPQEAYDAIYQKASAELTGWSLQLRLDDSTSWTITPETLGITGSLAAIVEEEINNAFFIGRTESSVVDQYLTVLKLKTDPMEFYTTGVEKNLDKIDQLIAEIEQRTYIEPKNASMEMDYSRSNPVVINYESPGRRLDTESLRAQVIDQISSMTPGVITIPTQTIEPTITAAALKSDMVRLSSAKTTIRSTSTENRNKNIARGCEKINMYVVQAGKKFKFNTVVGARTEENGFFEALEIVNGEYKMGIGGGICQVSSTLHYAVAQAGLTIVSRRNHGIPVNYMDKGKDATVADRGIDYVFENNTGKDIYIVAKVTAGYKECVVEIYGRADPNGYTYDLEHEILEEIPIEEKRIKDKEKLYVNYTDEEHIESKGELGYKIRTYRVTKDANGAIVDRKFLYEDTYESQPMKIYVGTEMRPGY